MHLALYKISQPFTSWFCINRKIIVAIYLARSSPGREIFHKRFIMFRFIRAISRRLHSVMYIGMAAVKIKTKEKKIQSRERRTCIRVIALHVDVSPGAPQIISLLFTHVKDGAMLQHVGTMSRTAFFVGRPVLFKASTNGDSRRPENNTKGRRGCLRVESLRLSFSLPFDLFENCVAIFVA